MGSVKDPFKKRTGRRSTSSSGSTTVGNPSSTSSSSPGFNTINVGDYQQAFSEGVSVANKYGVNEDDVASLFGSDPYKADSSAPQMTAAEANGEKRTIQLQNNALEVRQEKAKQKRLVAAVVTEERKLIGDMVHYETAAVDVATKVVQHEIAKTKFGTEISKLRQSQEILIQQNIATQGTINLTPGIQRQWELKFEKQQANLEGMKDDVTNTLNANQQKRSDMNAKLFLAGE